MKMKSTEMIEILDENFEMSLAELCQTCAIRAETIMSMVDEGLLEPRGPVPSQWRFTGPSLRRVERVLHLQQDLRVNLPGAVLAVELLEEIERLQERLRLLENRF